MVELYIGDKINRATNLNVYEVQKCEATDNLKKNKGNSTVLENKRKLKTWHEKELMSGWLMEY